jgi:uracil phosphoribosyltransferase
MFFNLSDQNSIASRFLLELRDKEIQRDRMRFRLNLERLGRVMAYEVSKQLPYSTKKVSTSLGIAEVKDLIQVPVIISILRAGLPFLQGFLDIFDAADTGFIGAYRNEKGESLTIAMDYLATPALEGRDVIVVDPMLATGGSLVTALTYLLTKGNPRSINIVSVIVAPEGLRRVEDFFQKHKGIEFNLWVGAMDERLNELFYIVPGLGDAGDLSYGNKTE